MLSVDLLLQSVSFQSQYECVYVCMRMHYSSEKNVWDFQMDKIYKILLQQYCSNVAAILPQYCNIATIFTATLPQYCYNFCCNIAAILLQFCAVWETNLSFTLHFLVDYFYNLTKGISFHALTIIKAIFAKRTEHWEKLWRFLFLFISNVINYPITREPFY